jgi:hypothetical protein
MKRKFAVAPGLSALALISFACVPMAHAIPSPSLVQTTTPAITTRPSDISSQPCLDALFEFFPGYTEYCHGMKKWHAGRYRAALEDLKDAAGWASKNAQYTLGMIYFNGHHVPVNRALGLAWLMLSAERKHPHRFKVVLVSAYLAATPAQRDEAKALFQRMRPRYSDAFAAKRAERRYTRAMRRSVRSWSGTAGTRLCIFGLTTMGAPAVPPKGGPGGHPGDAGGCPATVSVVHKLKKAHDVYFEGLIPRGHVDVGPVRQTAGR